MAVIVRHFLLRPYGKNTGRNRGLDPAKTRIAHFTTICRYPAAQQLAGRFWSYSQVIHNASMERSGPVEGVLLGEAGESSGRTRKRVRRASAAVGLGGAFAVERQFETLFLVRKAGPV